MPTDLVRKVELAYRVCYKSEHKVSETSKDLVARLAASRAPDRHTSPLEHARIKVTLDPLYLNDFHYLLDGKKFLTVDTDHHAIIGNFRAFHDWIIGWCTTHDDWRCDFGIVRELGNALHDRYPEVFPVIKPVPEEDPDKLWVASATTQEITGRPVVTDITEATDYCTFEITTTRDILQELVRHRMFSFSVESTRYCNYGNRGYTFVVPRPYLWANDVDWNDKQLTADIVQELTAPRSQMIYDGAGNGVGVEYRVQSSTAQIQYESSMLDLYLSNCVLTAMRYDRAIGLKIPPQEARMLLPGALKTELLMTGTLDQWQHFLVLRNSNAAHPQIKYLAERIAGYLSLDSEKQS